MEFHISRDVREKLGLDETLFSYTGNVVFANVAASRRLAQRLEEGRGAAGGPVNAGALFAMGLIDELNHALVARYREEIDPAVLAEAVRWFAAQAEPAKVEALLLAFAEEFPNVAVYRGEVTAAEWLRGSDPVAGGLSNREAALEELLMLWLANLNPAFAPFQELFEDAGLKQKTIYARVTETFPDYFSTRPAVSPEVGSLFDALRAPMLASPDSITGQLEFIRERWTKYLGPELRRVLLAIDVVREEDIAIWMRFHPAGEDQHRHGAPGPGGEGFVGDEYVGLDGEYGFYVGADGVRRQRRYAADYQAPLVEYEAFSADQAWMPNVVLMAKSTYVWLEQLSKKYGRHIHRLDHIPDEELKLLGDRGITALWLIGLWERSTASRTIKRLRGQGDAVASAYSLKEYEIAEDLGGNEGYRNLRDRAAQYGLRLASDMVPNHMGIDSNWVIEHPEWFLSRWESPFPVYQFEGPDLSPDSRVEIKIEDHYYDQTDAAVVFRLRHHADGATRYMYHGNDGTTFAWNDTAQLDYSKAAVREHVMQVILQVARLFPIIRFDAAMVLAKRHVQRLWFPLPGAGGSIPSRAENAMSQEEFEALMPLEFWREVVDRVAVEVPGTLLLAEAFWLLEGYFVRTLGMHRVYNSAFMNMLRDEENAKYRSYLKKTVEFDPDILKRYVNFMSNPDERTAIDQFGSGDKFFGVCTLLATLPGLPMFGHGQIEGYTERYGMEFKQAKMEEWPNEELVARHQHEIAPLLKRRAIFAESANFVFYDFWNEHGTVDENVFAYSNRFGEERSLVLYNNRYESTRGTIHGSVASMDKESGELRQRSLAESLGLPGEHWAVVAYRDMSRGLEYLRRATDFQQQGLTLDLRGYQYVVLLDWRVLWSTAEQPWDRLCDALHGAGVYSVEEALSKLRLRPVHEALRQTISAVHLQVFVEATRPGKETSSAAQAGRKASSTGEMEGTVSEDVAMPPAPAGETAWDLPGVDFSGFLQKSEAFFAVVAEHLPGDWDRGGEAASLEATADEDADVSGEAEAYGGAVDPAGTPQPTDWAQRYRESCAAAVTTTVRLAYEAERMSTVWPASVSGLLPGMNWAGHPEQVWAPVVAWILLRSLPWRGDLAGLFDRLHLRSALAESFSALGLEGESAWRAAARVRVLLATKMDAAGMPHAKVFWDDADVRWLAGVTKATETVYLNKERFEELLCWMQLPVLAAGSSSMEEVEAAVAAEMKAAQGAGYKIDGYLDLEEHGNEASLTVAATEFAAVQQGDRLAVS